MKLSIPLLQAPADGGPLRPATLKTWIARCEDAFEGHEDLSGETLKTKTKILQAGLRLDDPSVASWWADNRTELKALSSWAEFTQRLCDRFIPSNWRVDALEEFYLIRQGADPFTTFVARLQTARNSLVSAGTSYAVSDTVMKNYVLFFCASRLRRRVLAIPDFKLHDLKLDVLINTLTTTWSSMLEDGAVGTSSRALSSRLVPAPAKPSGAAPIPTALAPLSDTERQRLRDLKGCFHCRLHPGLPGWTTAHTARDCPGDPARGIPARSSPLVVGAVSSSLLDDDDWDDYSHGHLAAAALRMSDDQPLSCVYSPDASDSDSDLDRS